MLVRIKMKATQWFAKTFPGLFATLMRKGFVNEPRWTHLTLRMDRDHSPYLEDTNRNREWWCDFVEANENPRVLEIGAGGMHDVKKLRLRGGLEKCDYHILDVSKEVLKEGPRIIPEVTFKEGSINKIPFPDNHFDIVYCRAVIEHQPDYQKPMSEMLRVSRGVVVIGFFRWTLADEWINRVKKFSNSYNIHELLGWCKEHSARDDYFIMLQEDEPSVNVYDDVNLVRTNDYLFTVLYKNEPVAAEPLQKSLEKYRKWVIDRPYDVDPPLFQAKPKLPAAAE
ncbi:MAG TPA: class I SAM-dependent methyltransferase [Nitrospinota bacterium]|nr:class I SAM-dependent methyltransferase [Nitrospinota bacterium]|tara:strand:+ start:1833 stop:2678 length:846 start_codon:yes stop_codon:yes gene_type:complete